MEAKQGYLKGMDQDSSFSKRDPNSYFSAKNFKVVTDGGNSSGSLETEAGTKIAFSIPNIAEMTLGDVSTSVIPAQNNLKIIGSCTLVDELILFTTENTSATTGDAYGQIWKCKYDENTDEIIGLNNGFLTVEDHLMYNQKLGFSTEFRINKAVALYETENKQRVYWTDNNNQVRVFNLADPNRLNTEINTIDLFPGTTLAQPVVQSLGVGSLTTSTQIQFTYRLLKSSGSETGYAPPSVMYPLTQATTENTNYETFSAGGTSANKSVTYTIKGLDTTYEVIQHIAVLYNNNGTLASISEFSEQSIPQTGEVTVTCSSLANATTIPLEEYAIINTGFTKAKDIEVQGNRLVAANLTTKESELNFDARAYRFNSPTTKYSPIQSEYPLADLNNQPMALLIDKDDPTQNILLTNNSTAGGPLYDSVPKEHDCINILNTETEANWATAAQQYKYQADGVTLGGQGKNISYEFTTQDVSGATFFNGNQSTDADKKIQVHGFPPGTTPIYSGALEADGTLKPIYIENQLNSMAAPWAHANFSGYARGEVYRFAIALHDNNGAVGFVEWIGDIRFPEVRDGFPLSSNTGTQAAYGTLQLKQLGIKFTVDVSSISDKISGYSIVRLPRETQDKSKLGTGVHMFFGAITEAHGGSVIQSYYDTGIPATSSAVTNPFYTSCRVTLDGDDDNVLMHLNDIPGYSVMNGSGAGLTGLGLNSNPIGTRRLGHFISPLGTIDTSITHKSGDYIETLGYYGGFMNHWASNPGSTAETDAQENFYYKGYDTFEEDLTTIERYEVAYAMKLKPGQIIDNTNDLLPNTDKTTITNFDASGSSIVDSDPGLHNSSYSRGKAGLTSNSKELHPLGIGNAKLVWRLNIEGTSGGSVTPSVPHMSTSMRHLHSNGTVSDGLQTVNFNGGRVSNENIKAKSVSYRRYLTNQYGGDTYESRSTNEYQYIGHYQVTKNVPAAEVLSTKVFGGDSYVNYFDSEAIERYNNNEQPTHSRYKSFDINSLSTAIIVPVESSVNTEYRTGNTWRVDRIATNDYSQNDNSIYSGWMGEDLVQNKYFARDFLSDFVNSHPNQLWASDVKINGELFDSWRSFPIANKRDVDGIYGPINKILSFKDTLLYYQDRAFGMASLDERSVINDTSGQSLVLGEGGVFPDYRYISTNSGTIHQNSVIGTESAVYHYDARLQKLMRYSGGLEQLSDLKGMSSFFGNNIKGNITNTDKTLRSTSTGLAIGVHGAYDAKFNRVLYTFLSDYKVFKVSDFIVTPTDGQKLPPLTIPQGTLIQVGNVVYEAVTTVVVPYSQPQANPDFTDATLFTVKKSPSFTLGYNELLGAFESFYDYEPQMYLEYGRRLLSVNPNAKNELHQHNVGVNGQFYGINSTSELHTIFAQPADINKIWNNIAFVNEVYDAAGLDKYDVTFDSMQFFNNYQDTGVIDITPANMKRRMRTWRTAIPRDAAKALSRMRNQWLECVLKYENDEGFRKVVHDIIYSFTPTKL